MKLLELLDSEIEAYLKLPQNDAADRMYSAGALVALRALRAKVQAGIVTEIALLDEVHDMLVNQEPWGPNGDEPCDPYVAVEIVEWIEASLTEDVLDG